MKKLLIVCWLIGGCSTLAPQPPVAEPVAAESVSVTPVVDAPVQELTVDQKISLMQKEIETIDKEIAVLEPQVIASSNRMDPQGIPETKVLKKKLFTLEQKKASLELQILTLTE